MKVAAALLPYPAISMNLCQGKICQENCHPFPVGQKEDLVLAHNGTFHKYTKITRTESTKEEKTDTTMFKEEFLDSIITKDLIRKDQMKALVEEVITSTNKLVFFDDEGNFTILNEDEGEWKDGSWYSNMRWAVIDTVENFNEGRRWNSLTNKEIEEMNEDLVHHRGEYDYEEDNKKTNFKRRLENEFPEAINLALNVERKGEVELLFFANKRIQGRGASIEEADALYKFTFGIVGRSCVLCDTACISSVENTVGVCINCRDQRNYLGYLTEKVA